MQRLAYSSRPTWRARLAAGRPPCASLTCQGARGWGAAVGRDALSRLQHGCRQLPLQPALQAQPRPNSRTAQLLSSLPSACRERPLPPHLVQPRPRDVARPQQRVVGDQQQRHRLPPARVAAAVARALAAPPPQHVGDDQRDVEAHEEGVGRGAGQADQHGGDHCLLAWQAGRARWDVGAQMWQLAWPRAACVRVPGLETPAAGGGSGGSCDPASRQHPQRGMSSPA